MTLKTLIKYIVLTICGFALFIIVNRAASPERSTPNIGGEGLFLGLPLLWWIAERTIKDLWSDLKRTWREIKQEREQLAQDPKSDDHGANKKTPRA